MQFVINIADVNIQSLQIKNKNTKKIAIFYNLRNGEIPREISKFISGKGAFESLVVSVGGSAHVLKNKGNLKINQVLQQLYHSE